MVFTMPKRYRSILIKLRINRKNCKQIKGSPFDNKFLIANCTLGPIVLVAKDGSSETDQDKKTKHWFLDVLGNLYTHLSTHLTSYSVRNTPKDYSFVQYLIKPSR